MRLPRFRLTIRWLLAIVVLVAVALGGFVAGVRWERDRQARMTLRPYTDPSTRSSGEMIPADEF